MRLILLFILSLNVQAGVISRQHADTISSGKKILASDLNDEFNVIQNEINGQIDTANVEDQSLLIDDIAQTESAFIKNSKRGCNMVYGGLETIDIIPPCEIYMDGKRGVLSATESVNITTSFSSDSEEPVGSLNAQTNHYLYAAVASQTITFEVSGIAPQSDTTRKPDRIKKYVGFFRTRDDESTHIVEFIKEDNVYWFVGTGTNSVPAALQASIGFTAADITIAAIPSTAYAIAFDLDIQPNTPAFPTACQVSFEDRFSLIKRMQTGTNESKEFYGSFWPIKNRGVLSNAGITNLNNCSSAEVTQIDANIYGFKEQKHFHE